MFLTILLYMVKIRMNTISTLNGGDCGRFMELAGDRGESSESSDTAGLAEMLPAWNETHHSFTLWLNFNFKRQLENLKPCEIVWEKNRLPYHPSPYFAWLGGLRFPNSHFKPKSNLRVKNINKLLPGTVRVWAVRVRVRALGLAKQSAWVNFAADRQTADSLSLRPVVAKFLSIKSKIVVFKKCISFHIYCIK